MKNTTRHQGKFEILKRITNSPAGNPRFLCRFAGFTCVTKPNSAMADNLQKFHGHTCSGTIATHYGKATLASISRVTK